MTSKPLLSLSSLYHADETAWLEIMAELVAQHRHGDIDHEHLSEYLNDMARRDRREVFSRLVTLLTHVLKWERQPQMQSGSWRGTIREQRRELRHLFESGTLRNHATAVLADAYSEARKQAADETELALESLPLAFAATIDKLVADE